VQRADGVVDDGSQFEPPLVDIATVLELTAPRPVRRRGG
jgi:hypothetical protein